MQVSAHALPTKNGLTALHQFARAPGYCYGPRNFKFVGNAKYILQRPRYCNHQPCSEQEAFKSGKTKQEEVLELLLSPGRMRDPMDVNTATQCPTTRPGSCSLPNPVLLAIQSNNWLAAEMLLDRGGQLPPEMVIDQTNVHFVLMAVRAGRSRIVRILLRVPTPESNVLQHFRREIWINLLEGAIKHPGGSCMEPDWDSWYKHRGQGRRMDFDWDVLSCGDLQEYISIARLLLETDLEPDRVVLHLAIQLVAPTSLVQMIVESDKSIADPDTSVHLYQGPVLVAAVVGDYGNFTYLAKAASDYGLNGEQPECHVPVEILYGTAGFVDDPQRICGFLKRSRQLECENREGWTPLLCAALYKNIAMAQALLEHGADIEAREPLGSGGYTRRGWTPLFVAVDQQHIAMVELLLQAGADVNIRTDHGLTKGRYGYRGIYRFNGCPLHVAVAASHSKTANEIVQMLLDHGADVNAEVDPVGQLGGPSALHMAISATSHCSRGVKSRISRTKTPLGRRHDFEQLARSAVTNAVEAYLPAELVLAVADEYMSLLTTDRLSRDRLKMLLDHGADVTGVATEMPMHWIAEFDGHEELWEKLRAGITGDGVRYEFDPRL